MKKLIALFILTNALCLVSVEAQTVTELLRSGSNGSKRNLVIIGDGFQAGQQNNYNTFVDTFVMQGVFNEGLFDEDANAFNIYRVNVNSTDSGVTQVDNNGAVTTARNTALGYRFSGVWNRCWMELGPNTQTLTDNILNNLVPQRDFVFVILNQTGTGGCRRGNTLAVTNGVGWAVGAHEMGHLIGDLGDEYTGTANYTFGEPGRVNLTINTNRATLKWRNFVDPATALPTTTATDTSQEAGLFAGGMSAASGANVRYGLGLFRPVSNCRMNGNTPAYCPVCYNQLQESLDQFHDYTFNEAYTGDFNGDGRHDLVLHNSNSLALYTSNGSRLVPAWIATGEIPLWDDFMPGDKFFVGDFNKDGKDDLFVVNFSDWAMPYFALLRSTGSGFECIRRFDRELPGWDDMKPNDQFFVADFDGDERDDIYVFNGRDWSVGYLEMLRSNGNDLTFVRRFDDTLPGWDSMKRNDQFYVADINDDHREELYVFNARDWSVGYLEMLSSTGSNLSFVRRYDEELPGWDDMKPNDQFFVADFDGNGADDLYVFNGRDWSMEYLEMLRSNNSSLSNVRRFDDNVPGWDGLAPNDKFFVADINGDKRGDLYAYNANDWVTEYLGVLQSNGTNLSGGWQDDWINSWNLGRNDKFLVANFNGGAGWDDLFVRNSDWFGALQSYNTSVGLTAIDPKWIHNHRYHSLGWW
ncbi:MAG: M64 family metallo-endopeptidase [Acidobacteriota bacterium]|nr:M64 family metallo-endopeptidase [Acidobacteriota bacterium]